MPELPELEVITTALRTKLVAHKIKNIYLYDTAIAADKTQIGEFTKLLQDRIVTNVTRHGKYISIDFDSGESLLIHLKLSGKITLSDHITRGGLSMFTLQFDNTYLYITDTKKYASVYFRKINDENDPLRNIAIDPLDPDFNADYLINNMKTRKKNIKSALMDQLIISGIGNIYSDEILFTAKINPKRKCNKISDDEYVKLAKITKDTLSDAIATEKSCGDDYLTYVSYDFHAVIIPNVHYRNNLPCPICKNKIDVALMNNRKTYFCPNCQKN